MKKFNELIKEINRTLNQLILFDVLVNTILLFLIVYLVLALFNLYPILSIVPSAIYFLISATKKLSFNKMKAVEGKYFHLKERLRTAADNMQKQNAVVNELQEEVIHDVKRVGISSFLDPKNLSIKIFVSVILAFTIVFISTMNLAFLDVENLLKQIPEYIENNPIRNPGQTFAFDDVNLSEDLYGEEDIALLGNEKINIKIQPSNFKVSVKEGGEIEEKQFDEIAADNVFVESSEVFEENIPTEERELVKTYFKKITG